MLLHSYPYTVNWWIKVTQCAVKNCCILYLLYILHLLYITPAVYYTCCILHLLYVTAAVSYTCCILHLLYILPAVYYTCCILHLLYITAAVYITPAVYYTCCILYLLYITPAVYYTCCILQLPYQPARERSSVHSMLLNLLRSYELLKPKEKLPFLLLNSKILASENVTAAVRNTRNWLVDRVENSLIPKDISLERFNHILLQLLVV